MFKVSDRDWPQIIHETQVRFFPIRLKYVTLKTLKLRVLQEFGYLEEKNPYLDQSGATDAALGVVSYQRLSEVSKNSKGKNSSESNGVDFFSILSKYKEGDSIVQDKSSI